MSERAAQRKALSKGLDRLNERMVTLAELSELAIRKAMDSLARRDPVLAQEVMLLDREIYALQVEVEGACADLIALHAPVARDLRTVTTSLKITTDLDRIGRYGRDIAEITLQMVGRGGEPVSLPPRLREMADLTIEMVDTATDAFVKRYADTVRDIMIVDDKVDALHQENFRDLVGRMASGAVDVETGARYLYVNRYLERVADHAVNIGERVVYMVTGERPKPPADQG